MPFHLWCRAGLQSYRENVWVNLTVRCSRLVVCEGWCATLCGLLPACFWRLPYHSQNCCFSLISLTYSVIYRQSWIPIVFPACVNRAYLACRHTSSQHIILCLIYVSTQTRHLLILDCLAFSFARQLAVYPFPRAPINCCLDSVGYMLLTQSSHAE